MKTDNNKKYDLEDRLIEFAVLVITIAENLKNSRAGNHIASQIVRSGTLPSLNYGEAQSAESLSDFIHKFKILLKELRETRVALKIIKRVTLINDIELVDKGLNECNELISIFVKSIDTAKKNKKKNANN